ncbi:MAG TPA: T9SS type A sorting domain-containing protein [Chitinophagaceae bacterium]|nr:T9SS type A sorting domain-containing protein [Chitinophagaceae bacterium]
MKKYFSLCLLTLLIGIQQINGQLDMAFVANFSGSSDNSINRLAWTITNNKGANRFEIERCTDGKDFETIGILVATDKFGTESYTYSDTFAIPDKMMYRLKIVSKNHNTFYSRIVMLQTKIASDYSIKIMGNPAYDRLSFNYTSKRSDKAEVKIYDLCGNPVLYQKINSVKGNNFITIPLNSRFVPGLYIIEVNNAILCLTTSFIKQ